MKFDEEEQMLIGAYESDELDLKTPSKEELDYYQKVAANTFKKDKKIIISLCEHDYVHIQKKAMELGIPYQTLISGLIHRYVEGDLNIKTAL